MQDCIPRGPGLGATDLKNLIWCCMAHIGVTTQTLEITALCGPVTGPGCTLPFAQRLLETGTSSLQVLLLKRVKKINK